MDKGFRGHNSPALSWPQRRVDMPRSNHSRRRRLWNEAVTQLQSTQTARATQSWLAECAWTLKPTPLRMLPTVSTVPLEASLLSHPSRSPTLSFFLLSKLKHSRLGNSSKRLCVCLCERTRGRQGSGDIRKTPRKSRFALQLPVRAQ